MAARHSALIITTIALILLALVPAVSADEIYNRTFAEIEETTIENPAIGTYTGVGRSVPGIYISDVNAIATKTTLRQVEADIRNGKIYGTAAALPTYHWHNVPLTIAGNTVGYADLGFFKFVDGETPKIRLYAWVHELDVSGYTGAQKVYFDLSGYEHSDFQVSNGGAASESDLDIRFCATLTTIAQYRGWAILWDSWENTVIVENSTEYDIEFYSIDVIRNIDGKSNPSVCGLYTTLGYYLDTNYPNSGSNNIHFDHLQSKFFPMEVSIKNLLTGTWHNDTISLYTPDDPDDPDDPGDPSRVMVHIIAQDARNENLLLDAAVEVRDQYDAVVAAGTTSPEGWMVFEYDLPDTLTDEDFDRYYTVSVSLPGWTQKVTNFKFYPAFIPRSGDWIRVEMLPDTDGPADPEKTYIMFFVRDIHANPLERASIEIAGQYWHTNSAGHVAVEVPKNSTTAYTVRKTGHVSISGSAAVGAEGSYVVNIVLGPALPDRTPGPGDDPGATPPPRDTRTNEEKGKAVIDLIADNAELIATLAILAAVMGLINLIMPGRRRR